MRKMIAAIAVLLALLFAPVLWGLPPPSEQVPAELAWGHDLEQTMETEGQENSAARPAAQRHIWINPPPLYGGPAYGSRLLTFKSDLVSRDAFDPPAEGRMRGSTIAPAGGARR